MRNIAREEPGGAASARGDANPFTTKPSYEVLDIGVLLGNLIDSWRWIASSLVMGIALSIAYMCTATPTYRADALIQVEEKNPMISGLRDVTDMLSDSSPADTEIQLIRSRAVLGEAVKRLNLATKVQPLRFPIIGQYLARRYQGEAPAPARWQITGYGWGGEAAQVDRFDIPAEFQGARFLLRTGENGRYSLLAPSGAELLAGQVGRLEEAAIPNTPGPGLVRILVGKLRALPGTLFALENENVAGAVDSLEGNLDVEEQGKDTGIIQLRLKGEDPDLIVRTLDTIAETYVSQNVRQKSAQADKTLSFVESQLPDLKAKLDRAESALQRYESKTGTVNLDLETKAILDRSVDIDKSLSELALERARLVERFTPSHPSVVALERQIASLQKIKAENGERLRQLPDAALKSIQLMRDVQVSNDLYLLLVNKSQELRIVKSGTVGNVRIVDAAQSDSAHPIWPRRGVVLLLGLLGGLAIGGGLSGVRGALNRGIEDPDVLETRIALPVFATIPHSPTQNAISRRKLSDGRANLLALLYPKDITVESLRSLRTSLQFAGAERNKNVFMLAGLRPQVGKSFLSSNLGCVIANAGKSVLLIDGDMRRGVLHQDFGMSRSPGLSEVCAAQIPLGDAIRKTAVGGVSLLTTGALPPNPAELLMSDAFSTLITSVSQQFDTVIVDAPPILAVTDSALIGSVVGISLLVVKAGLHPEREISLGLSRLERAGVNVAGLVLNDMRVRSSAYAYGRYGYSYHYEYGD